MTIIPVQAQIKHNSVLLSQRIDKSLSHVTKVKERLFLSSRPYFFSGKHHFCPETMVNGPLPQCPFSPKAAFHIQRAAFACFNVVKALFVFPAKDWPHINSLPSAVWEITSPWIARASCKINHTLCIFCIAAEMMMFYGTRMLSH